MKTIKKLGLFAFLPLFLSNCSDLEIKNEKPGKNEVVLGTKFKIVLPEDHRTGYIWQLNQDYNKSTIRQINEVWHGNDKGIYFHLEALSEGETELTFISRKYTDTADIKRFIVKIVKK